MRITTDERRAGLVARHHLAADGADPRRVVGSLAALHSSDPVTPYLSLWARLPTFESDHLDDALFETRELWRLHAMRRTLFVVPTDEADVYQAGAGRAIAERERARVVGWLSAETTESAAAKLLRDLAEAVLEELGDRQLRTAELAAAVTGLDRKLAVGPGTVPLSSRLLYLMAMDGEVVRTRPAGSWRSSQYHWARTDRWFPDPPPEGLSVEEGSSRLLGRYLAAYGPVTMTDMRWWTGWTARLTRQALDRLDAHTVRLEDETEAWVAPGYQAHPPPGSTVALLPGLDSTPMGWKERDWYIPPPLVGELFDRNGNVGPTIWAGGCVIGGWAQGSDGSVRHGLLVPADSETTDQVEIQCRRLESWLDGIRVTPRFRTPLERRLAE